jgi:SAM-dependent methyltransferase
MTGGKKQKNYQSFPDQGGGSLSFDKLVQLRLPPLKGKSFLDVGCNEGFFCGYAKQQGANRVVGLDMSTDFLRRAAARFPDCEFLNQTWDTLPDGKFDVILLASAIHYADDQAALIARLVDHLTPDGMLVLELGIVSNPNNEWVPVKRSIDTRFFPTMSKLQDVLQPFAWKYVGRSVDQVGDPIKRFVIHIRRRRPVAYLLMAPSSYGKTYIANSLFPKADIPVVMGDVMMDEIALGKVEVSRKLKAFMASSYKKGEVDRVTRELFAEGLANDFIDTWAMRTGARDFAFDGFIPDKNQNEVTAHLKERGYFPIRLNWNLVGDPLVSLKAAAEEADAYRKHLLKTRPPQPAASPAAAAPKKQPPAPSSNLIKRWKAEGTVGFIDSLRADGQALQLSGWAIDSDGNRPDRFIVHCAGKSYSSDNPSTVGRLDVQTSLGLKHDQVGYMIHVKLDKAKNPQAQLKDFSLHAVDSNGKERALSLSAKARQQISG